MQRAEMGPVRPLGLHRAGVIECPHLGLKHQEITVLLLFTLSYLVTES